MSALADNTAAVAAGYTRVQTDRGAGKSPRYLSRYSKPVIGEPGATGGLLRADGNSDVDQATADAQALAALNGQRNLKYGVGATGNKGGYGSTMTHDTH